MRRYGYIVVTLLAVLLLGACQRRPFAEHRTKISLNLRVKTNIINHVQTELPRDMRVDLYDPQTGGLMYTDYVGPYGGYIHPAPGIYDMIVYSIGSESTIVRYDHNFDEIEAALENAKATKGKPTAIIAKSVKGKGVSFMENQVNWHGAAPNEELYNTAVEELTAKLNELEAAK